MYTIYPGKTRLARILALSTACAIALVLLYQTSVSWTETSDLLGIEWSTPRIHSKPETSQAHNLDQVMLVIASQTSDNTTWLETAFPTWGKAIYLTDGPSNFTVPANKGRESMVYLRCVLKPW